MCVKTEVDEPTFQDLLKEFMNEPNKTIVGPCNSGGETSELSEAEGGKETIV